MDSSVRKTINARVPCQTSVLSPIACSFLFYCQPIGALYSNFYGNAIRMMETFGSIAIARRGYEVLASGHTALTGRVVSAPMHSQGSAVLYPGLFSLLPPGAIAASAD